MPDVISETNGKLCVGSYHMWRLLSNPDNYSFTVCFGSDLHMTRTSGVGPPGIFSPNISELQIVNILF